jgi:hypothetical protein
MPKSTSDKVNDALIGTGIWLGGRARMYNDKRKTFRRLKIDIAPILGRIEGQSWMTEKEVELYKGWTEKKFFGAFDAELKKQFGDDLIKNMPYRDGYKEYVVYLKL